MTCSAEEYRWLMEWAAFLLIIIVFSVAAAYRLATLTKSDDQHD